MLLIFFFIKKDLVGVRVCQALIVTRNGTKDFLFRVRLLASAESRGNVQPLPQLTLHQVQHWGSAHPAEGSVGVQSKSSHSISVEGWIPRADSAQVMKITEHVLVTVFYYDGDISRMACDTCRLIIGSMCPINYSSICVTVTSAEWLHRVNNTTVLGVQVKDYLYKVMFSWSKGTHNPFSKP